MTFDIGALYKMLPSKCEFVDLDLLDVMLRPLVSGSHISKYCGDTAFLKR